MDLNPCRRAAASDGGGIKGRLGTRTLNFGTQIFFYNLHMCLICHKACNKDYCTKSGNHLLGQGLLIRTTAFRANAARRKERERKFSLTNSLSVLYDGAVLAHSSVRQMNLT